MGRLQFRRHLALCALLLLLQELARPARQPRLVRAAGSPIDDDSDERSPAQAAFDWIGGFMPRIDLNYTLRADERFENHLLDQEVEAYYEERFPANATVDELQLLAVKASVLLAPMPIHSSWGYAAPEEERRSAEPVGSAARCRAHLGQLGARLRRVLAAGVSGPAGPRRVAHEATPVENLEAAQVERATDLDLFRYLDTFGRAPSDLLRGNVKWYGSYAGCMDTRMPADPDKGGTRRIRFRYCMAALKSARWPAEPDAGPAPNDSRPNYGVHTATLHRDAFFLRVGVCMPEACDSKSLEDPDNAAVLERLLKFNLLKPFNSDHYYMSDLYCIPDERSPLRAVPLAGKLLLAAALGWLALIGLASAVHLNVERFYRKAVKEIRRQDAEGTCEEAASGKTTAGETNNEFRELDVLGLKRRWLRLNVYLFDRAKRLVPGVDLIDCLSLYSNWLRYTRRVKLAVVQLHADEQRRARRRARNAALVEEARRRAAGRPEPPPGPPDAAAAERELSRRDEREELEADLVKQRVDTSSLNALKVIALVWIIAGHCVFYLGSAISDGALLKNYARDLAAFALANGAMYITELFFVITGCLTTYLAFKLNSERPQAEPDGEARVFLKPRVFRAPFWLAVCLHRYLRILPTYLLVYAYVRLVSVYVGGKGPTWDYAVGANSMRRKCVQESWLPVLTLTSNFVNIYDHCIVGGWYLSVDMQFMLVSVPIMITLALCQRRRRAPARGQFVAFSKDAAAGQVRLTGPGEQPAPDGLVELEPASRRLLLGYALVAALGLLSAALAVLLGIYQSQVDLSILLRFVPHAVSVLSRSIAMYTNSVFRFRAFAFGLILGHLLYLYQFRLLHLHKFVQQHGAKLTSAIFAVGFTIMFLPTLYPKGKIVLSHDTAVIGMVLAAGGIDIFLCALIFLTCIGKAPKAALFVLNSPAWSLLSQLSLCAFVIHTEIIVLLSSQLSPLPSATYWLLLYVFSTTLLLTYTAALALYLAFEMPFGRLVEAIMIKCLAGEEEAQRRAQTAAG